eukprot:4677216-Amphidinium_carterae.1
MATFLQFYPLSDFAAPQCRTEPHLKASCAPHTSLHALVLSDLCDCCSMYSSLLLDYLIPSQMREFKCSKSKLVVTVRDVGQTSTPQRHGTTQGDEAPTEHVPIGEAALAGWR